MKVKKCKKKNFQLRINERTEKNLMQMDLLRRIEDQHHLYDLLVRDREKG